MGKSTKSRRSRKVSKPRPDFPLFPHASGRWAKKVCGSLCYFGKTANDPKGQAALALWLEQKDDLLAGRKPRSANGGVGLADMVNSYLASADERRATGAISAVTFADYKVTATAILKHFGRTVDPTMIRPTEFAEFRNHLAGKYAATRAGKMVTQTRMMFRWAYESEVIGAMPRFGPEFKSSSKRQARIAKRQKGAKLLTAENIQSLLESADDTYTAIVLLGINGGLGNTDIAELTLEMLDLDGGWINYPRPKTGVDRRIPLWPETVQAIETVLGSRPKPKRQDLADRVFLTRRGGAMLEVRANGYRTDKLTIRFRELLKSVDLYEKGRGAYTLRHCFQTIGDEAGDYLATSSIMGHVDSSTGGHYRERISDDRLRAVTDHVSTWLHAKPVLDDDKTLDAPEVIERRDAETLDGQPALRIVG